MKPGIQQGQNIVIVAAGQGFENRIRVFLHELEHREGNCVKDIGNQRLQSRAVAG
jgi:hypothetical protein